MPVMGEGERGSEASISRVTLGSVCKGSGVLLTASGGALSPCDAPSRGLAIPVTRAAVQTYPQVREERAQQHHPHEVAADEASAAGWSRAAQAATDALDTPVVGLAGCASTVF